MTFKRKPRLFIGLFLLLLSSTTFAENCIKVGVIAEFTRDPKTFLRVLGQEVYRGASLAVDQINPESKHCFKLVPIDTNNAPSDIPALVDKYAQNGISLFVGLTTTSTSIIASDALQRNNALLFSPASPSTDRNAPRIINFTPSDKQVFTAILNKYDLQNLATIETDNHYMFKEFNQHFRNIYETKTQKKAPVYAINPNSQLKESDIEELRNMQPNYIFLSMTAINTAKVMLDLQENGINTTFILPLSWSDYPFDETNSSIKYVRNTGIRVITPILYNINTDTPKNTAFVKLFNQRFNRNPTSAEGDSFDALFLMNAMLSACDMQRVLKTPEECLQKTLPFNSLRGPIKSAEGLLLTRSISPMEVIL